MLRPVWTSVENTQYSIINYIIGPVQQLGVMNMKLNVHVPPPHSHWKY